MQTFHDITDFIFDNFVPIYVLGWVTIAVIFLAVLFISSHEQDKQNRDTIKHCQEVHGLVRTVAVGLDSYLVCDPK